VLQADQTDVLKLAAWPDPTRSGRMQDVSFNRIAWLITVAAALVTALLLFVSGYNGYGAVAIAVGLSAAINLIPERSRPPGPPPT
jgi:hypothetical protein